MNFRIRDSKGTIHQLPRGELITGLRDREAKDIFEGDILEDEDGRTYLVEWLAPGFVKREMVDLGEVHEIMSFHDKVVGRYNAVRYE